MVHTSYKFNSFSRQMGIQYRDNILKLHLLPLIEVKRHNVQHDNERAHIARVTWSFLTKDNNNMIPWPSRYQDLDLIEHFCDELDWRLRHRQRQRQKLPKLALFLQDELGSITQAIQRLIQPMSRRVRIVKPGNENRYWHSNDLWLPTGQ